MGLSRSQRSNPWPPARERAATGRGGTADGRSWQRDAVRAEGRRADLYGGPPSYSANRRSSDTGSEGLQFETHWYENVRTGQRIEFKTKITGGQ